MAGLLVALLMTTVRLDVTATVSASTVSVLLGQYASGYYTARGYTELWVEDWSGYADTDALIAAYAFGTSSNGAVPERALVTKINDHGVFPNRMVEALYPYNDDYVAQTGESAGRMFTLTKTWTATNRVWRRWVEQYGGTAHPQHPSTGNFVHSGTYPVGSGAGVKEVFWSLASQAGERIGQAYNGQNTKNLDINWDSNPVHTEPVLSEAGVTALWTAGNHNESAWYDGKETIEWTEEFYKVSDDVWIYRMWRQQLTLNGLWNPQPRKFTGKACTRTSGGAFKQTDGWIWRLNKNMTTPDDGLSTTSWDVEDTFKSTNSTAGLTLRAENTKPWRGMRKYYGPMLAVTGGNNRPFDDHLGHNLDDDGRADSDWPAGA